MIEKIELLFPDGKKKEFKTGTTGLEVAKSIGPRLAGDALAVEFNGKTIELNEPVPESGKIKILTWDSLDGKK
ncbi:MAG: TGS domain-containing protein, partial [archaeon]